jgi:hypothetical protein
MSPPRRFPPRWSIEEGDNYFVVRDREGQQLAYVHFDNPRAATKPLTQGRGAADRGCESITKRDRLALVPQRSGRSLMGTEAGGSFGEPDPPVFQCRPPQVDFTIKVKRRSVDQPDLVNH